MSIGPVTVCLEITPSTTFASALDWPGWCRPGGTEEAALETLAAYAARYAPVADHAGADFPATIAFAVTERLPGGPATAFAGLECRRPFPQVTAEADRAEVTATAARDMVVLVAAAWTTFDEVAAAAPAVLRKGPRGGGRDRDELIDHAIRTEAAYARKLGVTVTRPNAGDTAAIEELRAAIADVVGAPSDGSPVTSSGWTTRYAARRIAWHVLEHAWEMQDRAAPLA